MTNISMLAVCRPTGMLLRIARRVPDAHLTLNGFIVHVALPALVLGQIHGLRLTTNLLWPVSMPWLLFMFSAVIFTVLARLMRLLSRDGGTTQVTLFEAAMGLQTGGAIVVMQYGLNPALITLVVGIGIALAFLTLPLWHLAMAAV